MSIRPATELLPPKEDGREYSAERLVRLGDVDRRGVLRLDGMSRYLQDVATDDAVAAEYPDAFGWVVRRTMIRVDQPPVLREPLALTTFCSGSGRSWAERRTSIIGDGGGAVEAVSLWVQIDTSTGRPMRIGDDFAAVWGEAAAGRVVSSKLGLPKPRETASEHPWVFRRTDIDPFRHVNNAAYWAVLEELIHEYRWGRRGIGEVEFMTPVDEGVPTTMLVDGHDCWIMVGEKPAAALRWTPSP